MYAYDYEYAFEADLMEFLGQFGYVFLGIAAGFLMIALTIGLVIYIFQSVGLHAIAKRRGLHHAWLAWIPVGTYWIVGSIADQYQYVAKGKIKNKRKILLSLSLASFVLGLVLNVTSSILMLVTAQAEGAIAVSGMLGVIRSVINAVVSIALVVFWHMALYDLYCSCNPDNAVVFLILGIFFPITIPFFIFFNRKKDGGMPPRKPEPRTYIPREPVYEEPKETRNEPEQL